MLRCEQFGAMNMIYNRYSFGWFLDSMERLGIRSFELWAGAPHLNCIVQSQSDAVKCRQIVDQRGLTITCLTPEQVIYAYNIAASDPELRRLSLDYYHAYIEMASAMGVQKLLCGSGWGDYDEPKEEAWKRSLDSLHEMVEHAKKAGVTLVFEMLQDFESNLCNDPASTRFVLNEIRDPALQLCADTVPIRRSGLSLKEFFDQFGDRICHVHLTDGTPSGHVPVGTGTAPIKTYMKELGELGYAGDVTIEIGDFSWADRPEEATRLSFETVQRFLSEIH